MKNDGGNGDGHADHGGHHGHVKNEKMKK